jgi:hypothetical protein
LDLVGLLAKIIQSVYQIDVGRKGFLTDGQEHEGRISYEEGISNALAAFKDAQKSADCQTIILAEESFLQQELNYCHTDDTITRNSLTQGIQSFEDALRSLDVVSRPSAYKEAEKTHPTTKNRDHGLPKDAFHQACDSHRTRLSNTLRSPGINMIEKAVIQQRITAMKIAIDSYKEKQKAALK